LHLTTAAGYVAYTASTHPNHLLGRQGEYTSKVNWCANQDNSIEVFANLADAQARQQYLSAFRPPFGDGYDHIHGTGLLRLSADLRPSQAHALEAQFDQAACCGGNQGGQQLPIVLNLGCSQFDGDRPPSAATLAAESTASELPLYPPTPWAELNKASFICYLCTATRGDEVRPRSHRRTPLRTHCRRGRVGQRHRREVS
jgi:hypothetical protein